MTHLTELASTGRRAEAVTYFMRTALQMEPDQIAGMQNAPFWPGLEAVAHTLAYDGAIMGDTMAGQPLSKEKWAAITIPTLVMDGGNSPAWMHNAAQALAGILPHARRRRFAGQDHSIADDLLVPALVEFFEAG